MSRYGRDDCAHYWHPRKDGYEECCGPVICGKCGAFGCSCDARRDGQDYDLVDSRPPLSGHSNTNGMWENPYVKPESEDRDDS